MALKPTRRNLILITIRHKEIHRFYCRYFQTEAATDFTALNAEVTTYFALTALETVVPIEVKPLETDRPYGILPS